MEFEVCDLELDLVCGFASDREVDLELDLEFLREMELESDLKPLLPLLPLSSRSVGVGPKSSMYWLTCVYMGVVRRLHT